MKKILSSLFTKYMITFIGIMFASNVVSTTFMFIYYGVDMRLARRMVFTGNGTPLSSFAVGIAITTFVLSALCIFIAVRLLVKPIKQISNASKQVAAGDYQTQITVKGHDEVAQLAKSFNTMTQALSQNEYLHKDFVSNVSHEFKTPLTSLRGYATLLKKPNLPEHKRQEYLDIMIAETERLAKMTSSLLKLSELEHHITPLHSQTFSLDEQIRDAIIGQQQTWEQKSITMDLDLQPTEITGDQELLHQVWVNLISNAIKYSKDGGLMVISLHGHKGVVVKVTDRGIGMSRESQERAFDRFYKADPSRNSSGTGLGLAICKKIVELHGGTLTVESQLNQGSTFTVTLR